MASNWQPQQMFEVFCSMFSIWKDASRCHSRLVTAFISWSRTSVFWSPFHHYKETRWSTLQGNQMKHSNKWANPTTKLTESVPIINPKPIKAKAAWLIYAKLFHRQRKTWLPFLRWSWRFILLAMKQPSGPALLLQPVFNPTNII